MNRQAWHWLLVAVAAAGLAFGVGQRFPQDNHDSFLQANFPCQEDEGLMFDQQFGWDRVGCVSLEEVQ
jgi:hypothetical protein